MLELRFHGRGGQGTVLAAKILADAVLRAGTGWCMAIPEFGVERRGAPVTAYARISDGPVRLRSRIYRPDAVVVLDPAAARGDAPLAGLKPGGALVVNSDLSPEAAAERWPGHRVVAIPGRSIALKHRLGPAATPLVNTAMAGAVCALFGLADEESIASAVREAVPVKPEANEAAAREAFAFALPFRLEEALHAAAR
ncbi:MAG: 2-oxoacid:acceptor oxidoreductase family protein [Elusimicrobia bacterium]|nr:2-oxoacid:acceptor oxidoreductase family protein [Elusimicrobiota bacterium]